MPTSPFTPVREQRDVSVAQFHDEIVPSQEPLVLRGAVQDWPAVRAGLESPRSMAEYLRAHDVGTEAETLFGDPAIGGHFFYNDALNGFNFERRMQRVGDSLQQLLGLLESSNPQSIYVGALPTPGSMPGFTQDNAFALLNTSIMPRLWIGNRVTVQTHYDLSHNVACVLSGHRRFTLFPPEQLDNLYVSPLEFTLAGQPISMVRLEQPDFARYPRFREALKHARATELAPGDALFVPYMWWHHVESLDAFNVMVNYWWDDTPSWQGSPFEALVHAILAVKSLPERKRAIWQRAFEHYVFQRDGDPVAHLQPRQRGIQGTPSPQLADFIRDYLAKSLARRR
jgi:hypothetical protein